MLSPDLKSEFRDFFNNKALFMMNLSGRHAGSNFILPWSLASHAAYFEEPAVKQPAPL
jgi:hypothetical protein